MRNPLWHFQPYSCKVRVGSPRGKGTLWKEYLCTPQKLQARCTHKTDVTHDTVKIKITVKTIQTDIYKPDKPCGKRISTRKSVTYEVRRSTQMSFLLPFQTALLCSYHRKNISHSDGHSAVNGKTKSRYTDIKNRRELCSRFKMMFYVTALKFKDGTVCSSVHSQTVPKSIECRRRYFLLAYRRHWAAYTAFSIETSCI